MRRTAADRRVLTAIRLARMVIPNYAYRDHSVSRAEVGHLAAFNRIRIHRVSTMRTPAILTPPFGGHHRLFMATYLHSSAELYVQLHESGHVICGDADEPTILHFTGPLPEAEEVADVFALSGLLTRAECRMPADLVEARIRELVPLDDRGWQMYRVKELAPKVCRVRRLIENYLDQ